VTPQQSVQSGLPVFTPAGGVKDVGVKASATNLTRGRLVLNAFGAVQKLTGDTGDGSLIERRNQTLLGIGAACRF
jgi:outer membrane scaffolding protein for murein synthesis (MipA/OmpV family)